jgi:hypothetical protein
MTARRDRILIVGVGLATFFVLLFLLCKPWNLRDSFMIGAPFGRDFANFWLGGHFALTHQLDLLIDVPRYNEMLQKTFAHTSDSFVFSYPPHSLLFLAPFGALPFCLSVTLWTALNLAGIAAATRVICRNWFLVAAAVCSPAALTMVAFGHFGGMLALAAVFILTRGKERPVLAGICLALMSVKPQVAIVIGLAMLCAGYWRALMWSVPAGAVLLAASVAAFGLQPWINYITWTAPFHARLISEFHIEALRTVISLYAGLAMLGVPLWLAQVVQYVFGALVFWRAIVLLRRDGSGNGPNAETLTLVLLAGLLALPYVNSYDLAIAAPALTVALLRDDAGKPFLPFIPASVLWLAPMFALPFGLLALPIMPLCISGVLVLALVRAGLPQNARFRLPAVDPTAA